MRMRKKKNLERRMENCADLWIKDPAAQRGKWRDLMPQAQGLRLELGCGKGRFTAETAAGHPEDLYVAVERVPDAMVIAMERCREKGLHNVFFIDGDAACLSDYFAPDEVDLLYINFCDPWPSVKHSRRRLTHENFLRGYRQVLRDGGEIHFKSDNRDLFEWSLFQFPKAGFELSEVTRNLHEHGVCGVMTDYEEKFHNLGTPINRCVGTKVALPDVPVPEALSRRIPQLQIRNLEEQDLPAVLQLMKSNAPYYEIQNQGQPTLGSIRENMATLPPRCTREQKHDLGLWRDDRLVGVLDLIEGYPRARTLWVGFFMMDARLHRQGIGRMVAEALPGAAADAGMDSLRLGCLKGNESGHQFWKAMGFQDLREGETSGGGSAVWIMEHLAAE